jgi:NitT/TauT family transport system ATP-binding protein
MSTPPTGTALTAPRANDRATLLDVRGVQKIYTGRGRTVEAVRDLTFSVGQGELVCIVGPSGAGKTTLLKCIAGLLAPTSGTVTLDGTRVTSPPPSMAVVFQEYGRSLFPWMTIEGNVELPLKQKKLPKARRRELVHEALEAVGLADVASAYPWQLSGGMQQRVAIARAVAYQPQVLLMDEPFAAVDAQTRADLEDLIRSLWHKLGVTILFVTHDIDESVYLGQRVLVLSSSPTVVMEDLTIDLPDERNQLETRSSRRFAELRAHVYEQIQLAKHRKGGESGPPPVSPEEIDSPQVSRPLPSQAGPGY